MSAPHVWPRPCHTERAVGGTTVVEPRGEIDILTAPSLAARLDALTAGPCPVLALDLRPDRILARHGRLRLVSDSIRFRRILQCAQLAGVFDIHADLPADFRAVPDGHAVPVA